MAIGANDNDLEAWETELRDGITALELLEDAYKIAQNLFAARNAAQSIDVAIAELNMAVSKSALKAGRLRRLKENVNG